MSTNFLIRASIFSIPFCLFSCSKNTYILNSPNVSFFKAKGEKELQCHVNYRSVQPQWAMSISDKFAYQINSHVGFLGQSYGEGLFGYYLNPGKFYLESFVGVGYGYLDFSNGSTYYRKYTSTEILCDYIKLPVQLNIAIENDNGKKLFLANRLSFLNYFHYNYFNEDGEYYKPGPGSRYVTESSHGKNINGLIWDIGLGFKKKNFIFNFGTSVNGFKIQKAIQHIDT